jgi:hypothetical protein
LHFKYKTPILTLLAGEDDYNARIARPVILLLYIPALTFSFFLTAKILYSSLIITEDSIEEHQIPCMHLMKQDNDGYDFAIGH